jgi:acyl-CoA reductase-like NAD-dependent aldehyde dehydrogenase
MSRLPITKTPKCYVGGAFIRSESGRVTPLTDAAGSFFANVPQCSRKDLRNAVEAAAKAGPGWARRSAFNRGQILYRLGEMMEARAAELTAALMLGGMAKPDAQREVAATVDRVIHYAGWTDKYEAVLGSVNPVASPHFNFTVTDPMGIIGVIAPAQPPLLGLLSLILPAITSGNCVVALASSAAPYPAILLGEMLATSDLPGGVVNLLTGSPAELIPVFASHEHLRGVAAAVDAPARAQLRRGAADAVKRLYLPLGDEASLWFSDTMQGADAIRQWVEFKTTWHPIGS